MPEHSGQLENGWREWSKYVLKEIESIRADIKEMREKTSVLTTLNGICSKLEAHEKTINEMTRFDLAEHEKAIKELQKFKWQVIAAVSTVQFLIGTFLTLFMHYLSK